MAKVFAMYRTPADPAAFDRYYFETHVPIATKLPGLRGYDVTRGSVSGLDGTPAPYHLIATLTFDSRAAIEAALASPEGQATAADLANFAAAGVDLYYAESEAV
jgi:uncharacterized protein (TIGR02118 family)